jgi:sec-independent protein translocase protein TatB
MFEVGFSELVMVGLVALLVIGPEQLPKAARIAGFWLGKSRDTVAAFKAEISQELLAEEMRQLQQQLVSPELQAALDETQAALTEAQVAVQDKTVDASDRPKQKPLV